MNNNKLIAEFMGIESFKDSLASLHQGKINVDVDVYEQAQYHTSWDWLMPVLVKIERIEVGGGTWTSVYFDIEREYKKAVEFIKKYNDEQ